MKPIVKICLAVVFITIHFQLYSQAFLTENKMWRIGYKISTEPCCFLRNGAYQFKGDTTINGTTYVKLYESEDESLTNWKVHDLWWETSDKKVYCRFASNNVEKLMYDFSLEKNDTFLTEGFVFKVDSVISKEWGGKIRKHWYLNRIPEEERYRTVWIEGVGQESCFLSNISGYVGSTQYLLCFSENGQQVYQNPNYNTCFITTSAETIPEGKKDLVEATSKNGKELTINTTETGRLTVTTTDGRVVLQKRIAQPETIVHLTQSGIYLYRFATKKGEVQTGKVVVK